MNKLQKALGINVLFSAFTGLALITSHHTIALIFGFNHSTTFWIIGIALILFASTIVYEMFRQKPLAVLWIIVQDMLWVLASIIILIFQVFEISKAGNISIAVVALIVFMMAINQSSALAQTDNTQSKGIKRINFERAVKAPKSEVWKVIADVANYHQFATNLDDVKIISGEGQGMVRTCSHGKDSWTETCSEWVEEKTYSFVVNTSAPDYPYPLKYLKGTWEVQEIDDKSTKIIMFFEFRYKHKIQNIILHPFLIGKFKKTAEKLLDNWQNILEIKKG